MQLPKTAKLKEGHREQFERDLIEGRRLRTGVLGMSGQARLMVDLNLDRQLLGQTAKSKRIRRNT